MRVKALTSFVGYDGAGTKHRAQAGDEFELPAGVDWLEKGLVVEAEKPKGKKQNVSIKTGDAAGD